MLETTEIIDQRIFAINEIITDIGEVFKENISTARKHAEVRLLLCEAFKVICGIKDDSFETIKEYQYGN